MKIAPWTKAWIRTHPGGYPMAAELRALLAVARAAQKVWVSLPSDTLCTPVGDALGSALDRLRKVSK